MTQMSKSSEEDDDRKQPDVIRKGLFTLNGKVFLLDARLSAKLVEFLEGKSTPNDPPIIVIDNKYHN